MISIQGVRKSFHNTTAVDGLTLDVKRGEVLGFLGPNGAGKTTTMRMITGFIAPDEGSILIAGTDVADNDLSVRRRIGYLPENNPLYHDMLVGEHLDFIADIRGLSGSERKDAVAAAVTDTGLEHVYYRPIGELSKGYRQRTGLAAAILHRPDILILDEPTEGLDPNQRVEIRDLIRRLGQERTVLLSTHVLQEIRAVCDRVAIINGGKLAAEGTIEELAAQASGVRRVLVEIVGTSGHKAADALRELAGIKEVVEEVDPDGADTERVRLRATVAGAEDIRPHIFSLAKKKRWTLYELHQEEVDMEDIFRGLTLGDDEDRPRAQSSIGSRRKGGARNA